jgi:hypothetical protein
MWQSASQISSVALHYKYCVIYFMESFELHQHWLG